MPTFPHLEFGPAVVSLKWMRHFHCFFIFCLIRRVGPLFPLVSFHESNKKEVRVHLLFYYASAFNVYPFALISSMTRPSISALSLDTAWSR